MSKNSLSSPYSFNDEKFFYTLIFKKFGISQNKALDIGCGSGFFTDLLNQLDLKTIGVDLDIERIKQAHSHRNSDYLVSDSMKLPFSKNTFDLILSRGLSTFYTDNIHDSSDQRDALFELLKNNGTLIFITASNLSGKRNSIKHHQLKEILSFFKLPNTNAWVYFFFGKNYLFRILGNSAFNPIFTKLSVLMTKLTKRSGYIVCIIKIQKSDTTTY